MMTSPDADDDVREASDLLQLMEFYRALHGTRPQTGGWIGCLFIFCLECVLICVCFWSEDFATRVRHSKQNELN